MPGSSMSSKAYISLLFYLLPFHTSDTCKIPLVNNVINLQSNVTYSTLAAESGLSPHVIPMLHSPFQIRPSVREKVAGKVE